MSRTALSSPTLLPHPLLPYPPTRLPPPTLQGESTGLTEPVLHILQLTDLHLSTPSSTLSLPSSTHTDGHVNCPDLWKCCLEEALSAPWRCDFILLTGDLVDRVLPELYDSIFATLDAIGIPYACVAGNHDVTDELDTHLPFAMRRLIAREPHPYLLSRQRIANDDWQLLLLNSGISGKVEGALDTLTLAWLDETLQRHPEPAILALHHPVVPINSAWLDTHQISEYDDFWHILAQHPQVKAVVCGHAHQAHDLMHQGVRVLITPSTCYQFLPNSDDFALDSASPPGYRWLQLRNNGNLASWVKRLDTCHPKNHGAHEHLSSA